MKKRSSKLLSKIRGLPSTLMYPMCRIIALVNTQQSARILTYHRIDDDPTDRLAVSPNNFVKQMQMLQREGFRVISLNEVVANLSNMRQQSKKTVVLTFDDGYLDNNTKALPILTEFGYTATFFIATGFVNKDYQISLSTTTNRPKAMDWDAVKALAENGMTIGAHTVSHARLTELPLPEAIVEIEKSSDMIGAKISGKVELFCYPGGNFNIEIQRLVNQAGYIAACSVQPGAISSRTDLYALRRTEISGDDSIFDFKKKLYGAYDLQHRIWQAIKDLSADIKRTSNRKKYRPNIGKSQKNRSNKCRILHLIEDLDYGGAERQLITIATGTDPTKYQVQVCCLSHAGALAKELKTCGITVFVLDKQGRFDLRAFVKLIRLLRKHHIEILHTHIFTANLWGRLASVFVPRVRIVQHEHSHFTLDSTWRRFLEHLLSHRTHRILVVSKTLKKAYANYFQSTMQKVKVVYNGSTTVDNWVTADTKLTHSRPTNGYYYIAIVGSLEPRKDHHTFLQAAKLVAQDKPSTRFLVIGDGPLRAELENEVQVLEMNGTVQFLGWRNDIHALLQQTDIYVSASLTEGTSLALLEAMAAGVPVICTKVGGNPEVIKHDECGILVPPQDPVALSTAIKNLLADPNKRMRLAHYGREFVSKHFSATRMIRQVEKVYEELMQQ